MEKKTIIKSIFIILTLIIASVYLFVELNGVDLLFKDDGIINPQAKYQRPRRTDFDPNKPFFQWWYFTIKDLENNEYFTFHYNPVDTASNPENKGVYISFTYINSLNNWQKYEKFNYSRFISTGDYNFSIREENKLLYSAIEIEDGHYKLFGNMSSIDNLWFFENCSQNTLVTWDLDIHRIYGWYGQEDVKWVYNSFGIINWNTYSHCSEVEGYIRINNTEYKFNRTSRFRAYCDENWGENFPTGNPSIEYPWGWYYVGRPADNIENEISIISGIGYHDAGFPFYKCQGQFADIRLNSTNHIGLRQNDIWGDLSYSFMESSNDGDAQKFDVVRSNWVFFNDSIGSAKIPLDQKVIMESSNYKIILDFHSKPSNYNRLLFPHENYIFSDFEGIGVKCNVTIMKRSVKYQFWDIFKKNPVSYDENIILSFESDDAGIEYGYYLDINL